MSETGHRGVTSPIEAYIQRLHATYQGLEDGQVATYIPELAKADPNWFGICIATIDGRVYEVGDTRQPFTIQSISKPFTYGLAIEDHGLDAVLRKISVEPTGEAFNSISLAPGTGCPLNPMINAGAIAVSSLVVGHSSEDRLHRILAMFSLYAGRQLSLDTAVFESERLTGHRNRAIGHMLRTFDILTDDPDAALTLYFQQCSIAVTCRDLSVMAATLANRGVNPVTGERAVRAEVVQRMLSVMTTCGMYDYAGEWVYWVGIPAKSGVGGGILGVLPGQLGIGVFSPPLDGRGNSVRGIAVCKDLSRDLELHFLHGPRSRAAVRAQYTLARVSSKRLRGERERQVIEANGERVRVFELQGDLVFSTVEPVVRRVDDARGGLRCVVLDLKRVSAVDACAAQILFDLFGTCAAADLHVLFVGAQQHPRLLRFLEERASAGGGERRVLSFPDLDRALEWCEDHLLAALGSDAPADRAVGLAQHDTCRGLGHTELTELGRLLDRREFHAGEVIIRKGDPAGEIYLLIRGEVSVVIDLPSGQLKRLSTLSPGMAFGELAVVNRGPRNADVHADTTVECYVLPLRVFDRLGETHPRIKLVLLENLLRNVAQMLTRANRELAAVAE
jgi:glutaminase